MKNKYLRTNKTLNGFNEKKLRLEILNKVYFQFLLFKVRSKISFISLIKKPPIKEMLPETIMRTYSHLVREDEISNYDQLSREQIDKIDKLLANGAVGGLKKIMNIYAIGHNDKHL